MKSVLTLLSILFVAHHAAAQCAMLKQYNTTLQPACDPNDLYIKWPNYANPSSYYQCSYMRSAVVRECPPSQYFCYVLQECTSCANYIPAVQCSQLKTQNPPVCVPMDDGGTTASGSLTESTYPTPIYPTPTGKPATMTTKTTTTPKVTTATTVSAGTTGSTAPTFTIPTPPTQAPTTATDIPQPPSPSTNDPNVPMPPTPAPTPPSVNVEPPYLPSP